MWELSLKLAATALILVIALAGWILDHKWKAGRTRAQNLWARLLLGFICAGAVVNGFVIWHSHSDGQEQKERIARIDHGVVELVKLARERNPNLTEQEALGNIAAEVRALRQRTSELDRELDGVKRYGNVAELNAFGLKGLAGSGLRETSRLSPILNEAYISRQVGGQEKFFPRCDSKGIAAFRRTAEIDPDFPFSYWALSVCAKKAGDKEWQTLAKRAITILHHTTQIAGHHQHHDEALHELKRSLEEQ